MRNWSFSSGFWFAISILHDNPSIWHFNLVCLREMTEDRWLIASLFYSMVHMCVQLLMAFLLMLLKMHHLWVHANEYKDSGLWILRLKRIYKRSRIVNMASLSCCFTKSLRVPFWWTLPLRPGRRKMRRRNEVNAWEEDTHGWVRC